MSKEKEPLDPKNLKKLKTVVEHYREDIIKKWVDFFIYNREVVTEVITKKIGK